MAKKIAKTISSQEFEHPGNEVPIEREKTPIPQTDFENAESGPKEVDYAFENSQETAFSETDLEYDTNPGGECTDQGLAETDQDLKSPICHTGLTTDDFGTEDTLELHLSAPGTPPLIPDMSILQTDSDVEKIDPRTIVSSRSRRKTSAVISESDSSPDIETENTRPKISATRRPRRRADPIVSIDAERSVESFDDKLKSDLLDLVESLKGRKILSGTIQGVERSEENPNLSFAVIYHGEFKIIIPAEETVEPPADFRDRLPGDVMHYMITKRLGAEVDYIVKGVDHNTGIAAASRLEAMASKRRSYYFGSDRDGNNLLYDGIIAEARIVSVIRAGIFVDLFGVESYIPLRELSYQRWVDAAAHFQPGQRVLVKVLTINRSDREHIRVTASVKQAGEDPYEKALRRYSVGSRYVGTVSMVDMNGVFVSLDGGIDCLCSYPKRGRPPRGSRVTVRILGINHDSNRIWGAITHMTMPR